MSHLYFRIGLLLVALLHPLAARSDTHRLTEYAHTAWHGQRGAPADVVQFAQTPDGWLWVSSPHGLFRFDGLDFERVDSIAGQRLHSTNTVGLLVTRDGRLWVGGRYGGISVVGQGTVRVYDEADGLPASTVMTMAQGPDGSVWVATGTGLGHLPPGAARFQQVGADAGLPAGFTRQVLFGRDGRQWVVVAGGIYFRDPGASRYRRAWPHVDMMAIAEAPDGTIWGSDGIDKHYRVLTAPPPGGAAARAAFGGNGALFDRDGNIWILKVDALERRKPPYVGSASRPQQLSPATGLSGPLIQTVFEDREGNIWVGTSAGLDRLRRTRLRPVPVRIAFDRPGVIADDNGGVIIGDDRQPVRRYDADGARETLVDAPLKAAYRAPDGALWLANHEARWRRTVSGTLERFAHPAHVAGYATQAMVNDRQGRMWISMSRVGLFRIEDGVWRKNGGLAGLPAGLAVALTCDGAGRIWAGYFQNRIAMIEGDRVRVFGQADGLDLGDVQALLADGAVLWAGGQSGVAWYDGQRWNKVRPAGANPLRGVSGLVRTPDGDLWLHGSDGITRIAAADVGRLRREPARPLPYERFDALDGLVGSAEQLRPLPSLARSTDGRLWFATASEVATIDPASIPRNPLPPPVHLLSVRSGGARYDARDGLRLPAGSRDLQVRYTALSLAVPERVRFRYRLEGIDDQWNDAGARREAIYTNLRPGTYRFQVVAANEDGVWNEKGASLHLVIPPRFIETAWFKALLALLAAAAIGGLYLLRVRQLTVRMMDRMHERLAERERIARGLHDTLLQSVQGLILLCDQQARKLPVESAERAKLEQTLDLANALMTEGRDCITDLRAADEPAELGQELAQYGLALLGERFAASVHGKARAVAPRVRAEVLAIAREALFNASRHARANLVELIIDYNADRLVVLVRDDGCGMAPALSAGAGRAGHYGIVGMRERAHAIGADFALDATPGHGTVVRLDIAAAHAYPGRRSAALFSRLRARSRARAQVD